MIHLPLFAKMNTMRIVFFCEEDQIKVKYLMALMTDCLEVVDETDLCHLTEVFYEEDGSHCDFVIEAFLAYWI